VKQFLFSANLGCPVVLVYGLELAGPGKDIATQEGSGVTEEIV
jgi:hypothetical protein